LYPPPNPSGGSAAAQGGGEQTEFVDRSVTQARKPCCSPPTVIIVACRDQQFRLHHCSAQCCLEARVVRRRLYTAPRRALRLSRMLHSPYSRQSRVSLPHQAVRQDQPARARRERPATQEVPCCRTILLVLMGQQVPYRHAPLWDLVVLRPRPHLFRQSSLAALPGRAALSRPALRPAPALLAGPRRPFRPAFPQPLPAQ